MKSMARFCVKLRIQLFEVKITIQVENKKYFKSSKPKIKEEKLRKLGKIFLKFDVLIIQKDVHNSFIIIITTDHHQCKRFSTMERLFEKERERVI